jgi:uncharacterized Rmd1/YagE family protein
MQKMVNTVHLNCYKISLQLKVHRLADFFKVSGPDPELLQLQPKQISTILKYDTPEKFIWFFKYGCVCFINFDSTETHRFLTSLESIVGKVDFDLFSKFNENLSLDLEEPDPSGSTQIVLGLYAIALAKSTQLKYFETKIDSIYDRAERLVFDLQRGLPKPFNNVHKKILLEIVKLQLTVVNDLKILDRPNHNILELNKIFNATAEYYEFQKRFETIQTKIANLIEIITPYQKLGFYHQEGRLLFWEVIMIALFPLSRILEYFLPKILTFFHFL